MRMNYLDFLFSNKLREFQCSGYIKRIAHSNYNDIFRWHAPEQIRKWRVVCNGYKDLMASLAQRIRECGDVSFTSTKRARRTNLQDSH
jgi:hypothetical protein